MVCSTHEEWKCNFRKESEMKQEMRVRRKGRVSSSITFIMIHFVCKQKSQFPSVYVCLQVHFLSNYFNQTTSTTHIQQPEQPTI